MLDIRILGPLELAAGTTLLELGSRKQRAVLAILAIEANHVVSLDRLIDELWGGEPPAQAIGTLQAYVSNLRRILEPQRPRREAPRVLVTRSPGYVLDVAPEWLDSHRFEVAAREGTRLLAARLPEQARRHLTEALDLWRGPALADFAFESFAQSEALRLNEMRLAVREERIQADLDMGNHLATVTELEAAVALHPLRERLTQMLMLAYYRAGRQADALQAYRQVRHRLIEEMGLEPAPALRRMQDDILAQRAELDWEPPVARAAVELRPAADATFRAADSLPVQAAAGSSAEPVAASPGGAADIPTVGRRRELGTITEALDRAAAGRGRAVLVEGEPGIGKTRLVREAVERAADRGIATAWGGSLEGGGTPAYLPWVEIIRSLVTSPGTGPGRLANSRGIPELAQVVPEITNVTGPVDPPASLDADTARLRLFEATEDVLRWFSRDLPLVVVLDDLQWADPASLQLLGYLAAHLSSCRILLLGTYRPGEIDGAHPLNDALAALARHQVSERIALQGLSEQEVADLIQNATGASMATEAVATIRSRTEGNPFFVTELARLLVSEHGLDEAGNLEHRVPVGVRDVVKRRLIRLPEETVALLSLAAVDGREFELRVLARAAEIDPDRTLELVEAAIMGGLVLENSRGAGWFRFSHDLVRETILAELSAARRARLHARLGQAIEVTHGSDPDRIQELANHWYLAAPVMGPDRAIPLAVEASDAARGRLAYEQAEDQLYRALGLMGSLPAGAERDRTELEIQLKITSLVMMTKGYAAAEAGQALERARKLCTAIGETRELVRVLWGLMAFNFVSARYRQARSFANQLLEVAAASQHPAELVAAHNAVGSTALHQGEFPTARLHLEQALALPEGLNDPWLVGWLPQHPYVNCAGFLAFALWELGDPQAALQTARDAAVFAEELGHDPSIAHALDLQAWVASLDRNTAQTRAAGIRAVEFAKQKRFPMYVALNSILLGWARAMEGEIAQGIDEMARGLAGMKATGANMLQTYFLSLVAEGYGLAGAPAEQCLDLIEEALQLAGSTAEGFWEVELHRLRSELLFNRFPDRQTEAQTELQKALELAEVQGAASLRNRARESARLRTADGIVA